MHRKLKLGTLPTINAFREAVQDNNGTWSYLIELKAQDAKLFDVLDLYDVGCDLDNKSGVLCAFFTPAQLFELCARLVRVMNGDVANVTMSQQQWARCLCASVLSDIGYIWT